MRNILLITTFVIGILSTYCLFIELYSVFLSFFGYKKLTKYYKKYKPEAKFLILVAAHNEEDVIESTINNLNKISYPKELYDIYIVNDNSTDKTGEICDRCNMNHIDTIEKKFAKEGVGKSAGLQYALRYLGFEKLKNKYDLLLILDADNHVDSNILQEVNSQWIDEGKPTAIQAYLDSKNTESSIAVGYATAYNVTNRFFQLSKNRLGFNNAIGGTGFSVRMDWLIETGGFCYKSLVEDLEMSIEIFKSGGRVSWNHFVRIYDEKPDNLKISLRQRVRWCQGHWYVAFTNFSSLTKMFFKEKLSIKCLDQIIYLFNMGKALQLVVLFGSVIALTLLLLVTKNASATSEYLNLSTAVNFLVNWLVPTNTLRIILASYSYIWLPVYAHRIDGTHESHPVKTVLSTFYVGITYIYAQILGLLKCRNQSVWVKTPHKHKASNSDNA